MPIISSSDQGSSTFNQALKRIITSFLSGLISKANPDFDKKIDQVKCWMVEFDNENGLPQREVGLDEKGTTIVKMPFKANYGYWIDNNLSEKDFKKHFEVQEITKEMFEEKWSSLT